MPLQGVSVGLTECIVSGNSFPGIALMGHGKKRRDPRLMARNEHHHQNGREGSAHREPLIPKHGGYRKLKSFQLAQLVYDVTVRFCNRYIDRRSRTRTHDQMVQAARSGVQNIAEGSVASGTSKKMELKLTNVAKASLEELRLDYEDFLRHRGLRLWDRDDPRRKELVARRCLTADDVALWVKEKKYGPPGRDGRHGQNGQNGQHGRGGQRDSSMTSIPSITSIKSMESIESMTSSSSPESIYPELSANAALVLIGVATTLLDRQLEALASAFEKEGGFTERLYRTRQARRKNP